MGEKPSEAYRFYLIERGKEKETDSDRAGVPRERGGEGRKRKKTKTSSEVGTESGSIPLEKKKDADTSGDYKEEKERLGTWETREEREESRLKDQKNKKPV